MTISEEIAILKKRIPEQEKYIDLINMGWAEGGISGPRHTELYESAIGVLHNLRNRMQYLLLAEMTKES
jgi:hypothetical protein